MRSILPYQFFIDSSTQLSALNVTVIGKRFLDLRNLYLSGSDDNMFDGVAFYEPFSSRTKMQSAYPPFSAIVVPEFTITADTILNFTFPELPNVSGFVDIIVENEAGYGKLTSDTFMPFISSYVGAVDIQMPWVNGIIIEKG